MVSIAEPISSFFSSISRRANDLLTIGVDVGTTAVKAGVFDEKGRRLESFSCPYKKSFPKDGWVEQDPNDWTSLIEDAILRFSENVRLEKISSLCVCSQVNTHVFVDENGAPLMPAIVWSDTRAKDEAAEIDESLSDEERERLWGFGFKPDASYALSRALWLARHKPDIWARTKWIISPKDYCNLWLSGVASSDAFSSIGLTRPDGTYVAELDRWLPGFVEKLPPLNAMQNPLGKTSIKNALSLKSNVFTGTMDAWGNFIGSGVVQPGMAALVTGTSSIVGVMSQQINSSQGVIAFPPFEGGILHAGPTQAGSDAIVWFADGIGRKLTDVLEAARKREITASSPIFLPHLQGERAPLWDPNARGTFVGLNHGHDVIDMALAVMEGVAFSERQLFEACQAAAGISPHALRYSGGSSQDDFWSQLRADVIGVRLERLEVRDSGTLGAAVIAGIGDETFEGFQEATSTLVNVRDVFNPCSEQKPMFDSRYRHYREIYRSLKPTFDAMALSE